MSFRKGLGQIKVCYHGWNRYITLRLMESLEPLNTAGWTHVQGHKAPGRRLKSLPASHFTCAAAARRAQSPFAPQATGAVGSIQ